MPRSCRNTRPRPPAARRPDVLSLDLIYTPAFAAAGQLEDITDWAKSLPYFDQPVAGACRRPAPIRAASTACRCRPTRSVLIWNKKLFKQAGLDPEKGPTNWAEIEADADKVNALGGDINGFYFSGACGGCNIFTFMPLVWASGGDILTEDGKKATLDTPADARRDRPLSRRWSRRAWCRKARRPIPAPISSPPSPAARSASRRRAPSPSAPSTRSTRTIDYRRDLPAGQGPAAGRPSPAATISSSPRARKKLDAVEGVPRLRLFPRGPDDPRQDRQPAGARRHRQGGAQGPRPALPGRGRGHGQGPNTPYTVVFND